MATVLLAHVFLEAKKYVDDAEHAEEEEYAKVSSTLHPSPYALRSTPYTLYPIPYTLHPTSYTLHHEPLTLYPKP